MRKSRGGLVFQLIFGLLLAGGGGLASAAMMIDNYSSETNDRFQDSDITDQFFLSNFNLSGVGKDSGNRWATLIGPNTIISANHFRPSGTVSFFPDNDPASAAVELGITGDSQRIGNSDLWLARLDGFAPSNIKVYDYATQEISPSLNPTQTFAFEGEEVFMTGRSPSSFPVSQDQAYGTNLVSGFFQGNVDGLGDVEALRMDDDPGGTIHESFYQSGDSGSPLFFNNGGELLLLGIGSFVSTETITGDPVASFASYTGNDSDQIDSIVAEYEMIPEPGTALLFSLAVVSLLRRRSRQI